MDRDDDLVDTLQAIGFQVYTFGEDDTEPQRVESETPETITFVEWLNLVFSRLYDPLTPSGSEMERAMRELATIARLGWWPVDCTTRECIDQYIVRLFGEPDPSTTKMLDLVWSTYEKAKGGGVVGGK